MDDLRQLFWFTLNFNSNFFYSLTVVKLSWANFAFLLLAQYIYAYAFNLVRVDPIFRLFRIFF